MFGLDYKIVYRKGTDSKVVDALSRRPHVPGDCYVLSEIQPAWVQEIMDSYESDPHVTAILQKLAIDPLTVPNFTLQGGLLRFKKRLWVGSNEQLQRKIIDNLHASSAGGHSGFPVTYRRISQLFHWKKMKQMVKEMLQQCQICQLAKPDRVPYPGLLQPLPIPSQPWEMMTMDFIEGLPPSRQFNCILVVIDKLSKYGHFIVVKHPYTASTVAEAFLDRVYHLHGLSSFWKEFCNRTGIKIRMSSGQHPQTDGKTERVNQQVEGYLRCFISAHPHRWSKWLPLCELSYNSNWHSSIGHSPFEVVYRHAPCYFGISPADAIASSDVHLWLEDR